MLLLSQHDPSRSACYCCHNMTPVTPHVTSVTTGPQLLPMLRLSHDPSRSPCYCHMTPAAPHVTAVTTWPQPLPTLLLSQHDPSRSPCYCCHNWTPVASTLLLSQHDPSRSPCYCCHSEYKGLILGQTSAVRKRHWIGLASYFIRSCLETHPEMNSAGDWNTQISMWTDHPVVSYAQFSEFITVHDSHFLLFGFWKYLLPCVFLPKLAL